MDIHSAWVMGTALSPEARAREEKAKARAIEVFGDDDWKPVWWLKIEPALGRGDDGLSLTPCQLAAESEEGLQRVLALLDELAKTVTPVWKPKIPGQKRSGRHRSRR